MSVPNGNTKSDSSNEKESIDERRSSVLPHIDVVIVLIAGRPPSSHRRSSRELVGPVAVKPVQKTDVLQVPFITWGGDVATFYANGGLTTQSNTIFARARD